MFPWLCEINRSDREILYLLNSAHLVIFEMQQMTAVKSE